MKILKQGKYETPETWRKEVTCCFCKSELEIDANDIQYTAFQEHGHPLSYTPESAKVTCPVCRTPVPLQVGELPPAIVSYARAKDRRPAGYGYRSR